MPAASSVAPSQSLADFAGNSTPSLAIDVDSGAPQRVRSSAVRRHLEELSQRMQPGLSSARTTWDAAERPGGHTQATPTLSGGHGPGVLPRASVTPLLSADALPRQAGASPNERGTSPSASTPLTDCLRAFFKRRAADGADSAADEAHYAAAERLAQADTPSVQLKPSSELPQQVQAHTAAQLSYPDSGTLPRDSLGASAGLVAGAAALRQHHPQLFSCSGHRGRPTSISSRAAQLRRSVSARLPDGHLHTDAHTHGRSRASSVALKASQLRRSVSACVPSALARSVSASAAESLTRCAAGQRSASVALARPRRSDGDACDGSLSQSLGAAFARRRNATSGAQSAMSALPSVGPAPPAQRIPGLSERAQQLLARLQPAQACAKLPHTGAQDRTPAGQPQHAAPGQHSAAHDQGQGGACSRAAMLEQPSSTHALHSPKPDINAVAVPQPKQLRSHSSASKYGTLHSARLSADTIAAMRAAYSFAGELTDGHH
jgi:hypothetical protein